MPPEQETEQQQEQNPLNAVQQAEQILQEAMQPPEGEAEPEAEAEPQASESEAEAEAEPEANDSSEEEAGDVFITDLAEKLGVEPGDLYTMKVAIDGREPLTIGELKDAVQGNFEAIESEREAVQNERMQAHRQISMILQALPEVPDEVLQAIQAEQTNHLDQEYRSLLEVLPEWKDPAIYQTDRAEMVNHLKGWGFTQADLDAISDHRLMKYVRDNMARERRAKQVQKPLPKAPSKPNQSKGTEAQAKAAARARLHKAAMAGGTEEKVAAVVDILRNG